ncbi:hypothetical protein AAG570_010429 [Ranatra chinensis]|uniref:Gag-like protein n=1 Tax=Ranatra chinensis TaxID=642074 RepID=A0ABD0YMK1_9HEMI
MDGGDRAGEVLRFSLYLNPNFEELRVGGQRTLREIPESLLEAAIEATHPTGPWKVTKTACGLIAAFTLESDALALLNTPLAETLGGPVQVARFSTKDPRYKQAVVLRDVPWAVPVQEVKTALEQQGIFPLTIERIRQNIKIEVTDPIQYEDLLLRGVDFFGAARFVAIPERWRSTVMTRNMNQHESIIQCYRCQGFWHIAANCQQLPRCVRCGGGHSVDTCSRPRHEPVCCHCSGPHHAAYRHCPVRLQLAAATPVTLNLVAPGKSSRPPWLPDDNV